MIPAKARLAKKLKRKGALLALAALFFAVGLQAAPLTPQPTVTIKGLAQLYFAESGTRPWVNNFGGGSPFGYFNAWDGSHNPSGEKLTGSTIDQTYAWGIAHVSFTVLADKTLRVSGTITNQSSAAVTIDLNLCKIDFPTDTATDIKANGYYDPGYCTFDASTADIPCWFALSDFKGWPGEVRIGQANWSNNAMYGKFITLAPGATQDFDFHLNFVSAQSDLDAVKTAVNQAFAKTYPQEHVTNDLRSVGQIFFVTGTGASGWAADHAKWAKNPRGWLGDPTLDIANKAAFKSRMEAFARQCVTNAHGIVNMRGFVIWDIEGEQYPHGSSVYAGHPSKMAVMAPEMNEIADDLVNILKDGGRYEVGFCLRQQQFVENPGNPEMAFYLASWPNSDSPEAQADLENEINWCVTRWGPTADIYYVDSNSGSEVNTYHNLRAKYPSYLIFPESFTVVTRMYAYEPQYQTGRQQDYVRNGVATQAKFIAVYPHAQSVINLADVANNTANVDAVSAGMLRGDIEMARIWWTGGSEYVLLQKATEKAMSQGWPGSVAPSPTPSPSPTATPTPSPSPTATPVPTATPSPTPPPSASYSGWWNQLGEWIRQHPATPDK